MKNATVCLGLVVVSLFCSLLKVGAVETGPLPVLKVIDGDTIEVQLDGKAERVRLLYVDTPECSDNDHGKEMPEGKAAKKYLTLILTRNPVVTLWGPDADLKRDKYGCILAVVWFDTALAGIRNNANAMMVEAGCSPYWRKYGECPDAKLHDRLTSNEDFARHNNLSAWATAPQWMRDKANERTAPDGGP